MAVDYRFKRLHIDGFRGLKEVDLELPVGAPLHIIGSNNSGKTTALEALAFVLRGGGFHQYDLGPFDFYHPSGGSATDRFSITLHLEANRQEDLPAIQRLGTVTFVNALKVQGSRAKSGTLSKRFYLLDADGQIIRGSQRPKVAERLKADLKEHSSVGYSPENGKYDEIRDDLPEVMLLTPQNMGRSLYEWRSGPLNKLSAMLASAFLEQPWTFDFDGKAVAMPDRIRMSHAFLRAAVEAFPFWTEDVRPKLAATLSSYLGRHAQIELKPQIQSVEEWLQQQILLSFAADEHGSPTPVECMGDGWQSLIRLAALDVLSQYPDQLRKRVVLLLEEPETHLHPHLHRKLRGVLERLASGGWTVVTTTHSPEMVSFSGVQRVAKLRRDGDAVHRAVLDASRTPASLKLQAKINERGNSELLFANRVVLGEGKDDEFAFRSGLELHSVDLDARSVSVLGVGSRDNFPDYAKLLSSLGIPWCVVIDEDVKADGTPKDGSAVTLAALNEMKSEADEIVVLSVDLEHCLGVPRNPDKPDNPAFKARPEWQEKTMRGLPAAQVASQFPLYDAALVKVKGWAER